MPVMALRNKQVLASSQPSPVSDRDILTKFPAQLILAAIAIPAYICAFAIAAYNFAFLFTTIVRILSRV